MGDECHNRNNAGTTLLIQALMPGIIQAGYSVEQQREVFEFVASSDYFSGPTWMAMCKAAMDAAHGIEYSTVVTTMARNGVEFGLRVSGCLLYTSTAITLASLYQQYACVQALIDAGADINKQDHTCLNPFLISCLNDDLTLLRIILPDVYKRQSLAFQNTTFNLEKNAEFLQKGGITAGQGSLVTVGKGAHSISTCLLYTSGKGHAILSLQV